jgi:N-acetylmuramoyl-L-alanine amidase
MKSFYCISLLLGIVLSSMAYAKHVIVIDPGHDPVQPGAIGSCLKKEVVYNDEISAVVVKQLASDYQVILTRQSGMTVNAEDATLQQYLSSTEQPLWPTKRNLLARAALANKQKADIFISIHHDATFLHHQIYQAGLCKGHGGTTLSPAFKKQFNIGFNVFIYDNKHRPQTAQSLRLAEDIGQALIAIGRIPSNYHLYPADACKSCRPVNAKLGVWHEDLAVLRNTTMPAVLIEVGTIVDASDESKINNDKFRKQFARAVKLAVDRYFSRPVKKQ